MSAVVKAAQYEPPAVSAAGYLWRITVAAVLSLGLLVTAAAVDDSDPLVFRRLDLPAGLVSWVLVLWQRRRRPTVVAVISGALSSFSILSAGPALWALFCLGTTRRWSRYIAAAAVTMAAGLVYLPVSDPGFFRAWPYNLFAGIVAVGGFALIAAWGGQVGARRELLWTLRDRAERAEAERDLRSAQARSLERERIAREMHDVLAHRISQISMHAGGLAFRTDLPADQLAESAQTIRESAHQALVDLRDVLGVLRSDRRGTESAAESGARLPVPTANALPELIASNRAAGMRITTEIDDDVVAKLSGQIGRTVYRVVQEGLTNVGRHAAGAAVQITVGNQPAGQIVVTVSNDAGTRSVTSSAPVAQLAEPGFGLTGLQERVEMLQGTLDSGPHGDGWLLRAQLPWPRDLPADADPDRR